MICNDARLGDVDGQLGEVYRALRGFLTEKERQSLKAQEITWIKHRTGMSAYGRRAKPAIRSICRVCDLRGRGERHSYRRWRRGR